MLTNHYLDYTTTIFGIPVFLSDKNKLTTTNSASGYGSIGQGVTNCIDRWARNPNFVLLDWYDSNGNVPFNVAAQLNGVAEPTNVVVTSRFSKADAAVSSASGAASGTVSGSTTASSTSRTSSSALSAGSRSVGAPGGLLGTLGGAVGAGMMWLWF